jgi:hypothetical protein
MASAISAKALSELAQVIRISSISSCVLIMRASSMTGLPWTTSISLCLNASANNIESVDPSMPSGCFSTPYLAIISAIVSAIPPTMRSFASWAVTLGMPNDG